ncbi:hypothetical protein D6D15_10033 [Aureobasidium pullulans]|uniref:F-box domain-containing protein n=1 Tax=Aureobasidium pullulans TaxID=5580 RepID=A0A4S9AS35_AURPU|nr:hypothetical protein D6D15_10033 [Aureobasidium pullulans]
MALLSAWIPSALVFSAIRQVQLSTIMAELRAPHLPNEVYLRIANHLAAYSEDHELFSLRLISQIFTQGVDDHFLRVYYANRMCPATLEGLRVLRYMFQDLTLASSIQKLTMDEQLDLVASIWLLT